ncbi:SGT1 protein-domain-containing protein [Blastocladiella britannica]|nr:SGT1 protein-domain-containing protein [Blastocladiella britannica]
MDDDLARALNRPAVAEDYLELVLVTNNAYRLDLTAVAHAIDHLCAGHLWARERLPDCLEWRSAADPLALHSGIHVLAKATVRVADCIDDEWFCLLVLRALTAQFPGQLAVHVQDADGDPVLIEAADHLPRWVTPESAAARTWWCSGELYLVPPTAVSLTSEDEKQGSDEQLAAFASTVMSEVGTDQKETLAPAPVRAHIGRVLDRHAASHDLDRAAAGLALLMLTPASSSADLQSMPGTRYHHAAAFLPRHVHAVFALHPHLAVLAAAAVHSRDPISMRTAAALPILSAAPGIQRHPAWKSGIVRMTRYAYAQLSGTRLSPLPPRIADAVPRAVQLVLEAPTSESSGKEPAPDFALDVAAWARGTKLVLGLEMVLSATGDPEAVLAMGTLGRDTVGIDTVNGGIPDDDAWMELTEEELSRLSSGTGHPVTAAGANKSTSGLDAAELAKRLNAFGEGESGIDGIETGMFGVLAEPGSDSEDEDDDSDMDDLFNADTFRALFAPPPPLQHVGGDVVDSDQGDDGDSDQGDDGDSDQGDDGDSDLDADETSDQEEDDDEGNQKKEHEALSTLLKSLQESEGMAGPAATLLRQLGMAMGQSG